MFVFASLLVVVPIVAAAVLLVIVVGRVKPGRAGDTPLGDSSTLLAIARWGAWIYAVVVAVVTLAAVASALFGDVTMNIPVQQFWPEPDSRFTIEPTDATVVGGGFTTATVTLAGLDVPTRILAALGTLLSGGMFVTIAVAIAIVCRPAGANRRFTPDLARATTVAAVAIAIGGIASQVVTGIAASMASQQALFISSWSAVNVGANEEPELGLPEPTFLVQLDFWPILLCVVVAALAAHFRAAERLQRDTVGLV
ncbi:MAG: hypothetical protein ACOH1T_12430 [Microbacteriaceae bacterium]